jgi:hypothetical protein
MPLSYKTNASEDRLRVIRDQTGGPQSLVDVRFSPKATEALHCSEMTRRATSRHAVIAITVWISMGVPLGI